MTGSSLRKQKYPISVPFTRSFLSFEGQNQNDIAQKFLHVLTNREVESKLFLMLEISARGRIPSRWTWLQIYEVKNLKSCPKYHQKGLIFSQLYVLSFQPPKYYLMAIIQEILQKDYFLMRQPIRNLKRPWSIQPPNWNPCRWLARCFTHSDVTIVQYLAGCFELIWENKLSFSIEQTLYEHSLRDFTTVWPNWEMPLRCTYALLPCKQNSYSICFFHKFCKSCIYDGHQWQHWKGRVHCVKKISHLGPAVDSWKFKGLLIWLGGQFLKVMPLQGVCPKNRSLLWLANFWKFDRFLGGKKIALWWRRLSV